MKHTPPDDLVKDKKLISDIVEAAEKKADKIMVNRFRGLVEDIQHAVGPTSDEQAKKIKILSDALKKICKAYASEGRRIARQALKDAGVE